MMISQHFCFCSSFPPIRTAFRARLLAVRVLTTVANILSVYDIINAQYLVVDQAALAKIEEVYA